MQVHRDIDNLPRFNNAVITIGTFDGVHTGHQQITKLLRQEAARVYGESVIITFHPHPRMILKNDMEPSKKETPAISLLSTPEEKINLLEQQGIDHLVIVPFTPGFSRLEANDYIEQFLVKKFQPHTIIIGYDHRFGKQRQGDYKLLEVQAARFNYQVKEIPEHMINQMVISSTKIREAIAGGNIAVANAYLGYDYCFEGLVVEGDKLGRTIGYPTANLRPVNKDKLLPGNGVYAVQVMLSESRGGAVKNGMMNIGLRPTVGGTIKRIEVNIFDSTENIYGKTLAVFIKAYLRPEQKFDDLAGLKNQLAKDKERALIVLQ